MNSGFMLVIVVHEHKASVVDQGEESANLVDGHSIVFVTHYFPSCN